MYLYVKDKSMLLDISHGLLTVARRSKEGKSELVFYPRQGPSLSLAVYSTPEEADKALADLFLQINAHARTRLLVLR